MKRILILTIVSAAVLLTGCDLGQMVDSKVQEKVQEYFPAAEISHPAGSTGGTLIILTHVNNISEKFASQVMRQLIREHGDDLKLGMSLAGYMALTVDFEEGRCVWIRNAASFGCGTKFHNPGEVNTMNEYPVYEVGDAVLAPLAPAAITPLPRRPKR